MSCGSPMRGMRHLLAKQRTGASGRREERSSCGVSSLGETAFTLILYGATRCQRLGHADDGRLGHAVDQVARALPACRADRHAGDEPTLTMTHPSGFSTATLRMVMYQRTSLASSSPVLPAEVPWWRRGHRRVVVEDVEPPVSATAKSISRCTRLPR